MSQQLDWSGQGRRKIDSIPNPDQIKFLNLSGNQLLKVDKLAQCSNLEQLELHNNRIVRIEGFFSMKWLRVLNLSQNSLHRIECMDSLLNLEYLDLSNNNIKTIEGLERNLQLSYLDLSNNTIQKLGNLLPNKNLRTLVLKGNFINALADAPKTLPHSLRLLNLAKNTIDDVVTLKHLAHLTSLVDIELADNTSLLMASKSMKINYRAFLFFLIPSLKTIDALEISQQEWEICQNISSSQAARIIPDLNSLLHPSNEMKLLTFLIENCSLKPVKQKKSDPSDEHHITTPSAIHPKSPAHIGEKFVTPNSSKHYTERFDWNETSEISLPNAHSPKFISVPDSSSSHIYNGAAVQLDRRKSKFSTQK